jgi:hypothetical protein
MSVLPSRLLSTRYVLEAWSSRFDAFILEPPRSTVCGFGAEVSTEIVLCANPFDERHRYVVASNVNASQVSFVSVLPKATSVTGANCGLLGFQAPCSVRLRTRSYKDGIAFLVRSHLLLPY